MNFAIDNDHDRCPNHTMKPVVAGDSGKFIGIACPHCRKFVKEEKGLAVVSEQNKIISYGPQLRRDL